MNTKATKCSLCPRTFADATGLPISPEVGNVVGHCVCDSCREKSNAASLAAWRKLTQHEREGAATREERHEAH